MSHPIELTNALVPSKPSQQCLGVVGFNGASF